MTMKSKFTPGPWKITETMFGVGNLPVCGVETTLAEAIANCGTKQNKQHSANAQLMSASPDLYAFAECSAAIDCASCDPRYDPQPVLRSHGWNGEENTGVFLSRIRRNALEKAVGHYLGRAAA